MNIETDVTFDGAEAALGAAEWAAIQTVHFADSTALRWWCETNAIADQNVSNTHSHATCLDHDRIMAALLRGMILKSTLKLGTKATRVPDLLPSASREHHHASHACSISLDEWRANRKLRQCGLRGCPEVGLWEV